MKKIIPLMLLGLAPTSMVYGEQLQGLTVVGKASVAKAPDQFKTVLTVERQSRVVAKAKAAVDHQVNQIINALKSLDVPDEQITATYLQITPIYPNTNRGQRVHRAYIEQDFGDREGAVAVNVNNKDNKQPMIEFDLRRQVEVNLNSIEQYQQLLDRAVKIGISRISPVQSSVTGAEQLYQQALTQAVANAKSKAQRLAGNLGVELGKVKSLSEHAYRAPGEMMMAMESSASPRMKNYTGQNQITAEVTVTFSIKNE